MASIDTIRLTSFYYPDEINQSTQANSLDWRCSYCDALNPSHLYRCDNCYAPREECKWKDDLHG